MAKIEKLTQEQIKLLEVYRDKWIKIGLSTDRFTKEDAQKYSDYLYEKILKKKKVPIIIAESPLSAWIIVNMFVFNQASVRDSVWASVGASVEDSVRASVWASVRASVGASVRASVGASVRASVWDSVRASVGASVRASVRDSVRASVGDSVEDSIWDSVWASIWDSVWASVGASVRASVWDSVRALKFLPYCSPYIEGSFDVNIYAFFDYFEKVLNINYGDKKENWEWWKSSAQFGQVFPLENVCIISQKPVEINKLGTRLHADGKAAVKYSDGFSIWALNGVRVPQYLAETPASALDIEFFKKEQNADIKAEFIRKYGIERMVSMGKLIDTWENHEGTQNFKWYKKSEYKLIDMSPIFTTYDYLPYLYMKNQTLPGIYHLECCFNPNKNKQPQTILEGLTVRLNGINPETLEITAIA